MREVINRDGTEITLSEFPVFTLQIKDTIINELNTGNTLRVTMFTNIETENILRILNNLKVNENNDYIMRIDNNVLIVKKIYVSKTGL